MKNDRVVVEGLDGASVVALQGDFDMGLSRELDQVLAGLLKDDVRNVVVDLAQVGFVGSTTIGVLLGCAGRLRRHGGEMKICGIPRGMRQVFEMLGVGKFVAVCDDRTAALLTTPDEVRQRLGLADRRHGDDRRQEDAPAAAGERRHGERREPPGW